MRSQRSTKEGTEENCVDNVMFKDGVQYNAILWLFDLVTVAVINVDLK